MESYCNTLRFISSYITGTSYAGIKRRVEVERN